MGSVAILNPTGRNALAAARTALAPLPLTDFAKLTAARREVALARHWVLKTVQVTELRTGSRSKAITHFLAAAAARRLAPAELQLLDQLQAKKLAAGTVYRWFTAFDQGGVLALAPAHTGRVAERPWLTLLMQWLGEPPLRCASTYAELLAGAGFAVTARQVQHTLKKLPAHLTTTGNAAVGAHYRQQNLTPHRRMDRTAVPAGVLWQGDGHLLDWYSRHHRNGRPHRYEYTQWTDVGSDLVVGWWLSDAESGRSTYFSLCHAVLAHDHVPSLLHVDPGSGFKSKMITAEVTGLAARLGFEVQFARPGNARGKGRTEGSFRWLEEKVGKGFGRAYCGHDMPADLVRTQLADMDKGRIYVPSLDETVAVISAYHAARAHKHVAAKDGERTRLELWQARTRNPLHLPTDLLLRPVETCTVKSFTVRLFNRHYQHAELNGLHGREVQVAYNLHDHRSVGVRTLDGRWLCEAQLIEVRPGLSDSRLEDLEAIRLREQGRRKALKQAENEDKARRPLEAEGWQTAESAVEHWRMPGVPMLAEARATPRLSVIEHPRAPVAAEAIAAVVEGLAERERDLHAETAADRFARWQRLRVTPGLDDVDARWIATYADQPECRARLALLDDADA